MTVIHSRYVAAFACALILAGCSVGSPTPSFSVSNASVDQSYTCPVGAKNASYDLHGSIAASNGSSKPVTISNVAATMTLAAANGGWMQKVGDKYDASSVIFTPDSVGAASNAAVSVTIPSACTGRAAKSSAASADYTVSFTLTTSAGTFTVDSKNKHRIITA